MSNAGDQQSTSQLDRAALAARAVAVEKQARFARGVVYIIFFLGLGLIGTIVVHGYLNTNIVDDKISDKYLNGYLTAVTKDDRIASLTTEQLAFLSRYTLEADATRSRHRTYYVLIASRSVTVFAIMFGSLIMIAVGSIFILNKITDAPFSAQFGKDRFTAQVQTASPGLILALLGIVAMSILWLFPQTVSLTDISYFGDAPVEAPPPTESQSQKIIDRETPPLPDEL